MIKERLLFGRSLQLVKSQKVMFSTSLPSFNLEDPSSLSQASDSIWEQVAERWSLEASVLEGGCGFCRKGPSHLQRGFLVSKDSWPWGPHFCRHDRRDAVKTHFGDQAQQIQAFRVLQWVSFSGTQTRWFSPPRCSQLASPNYSRNISPRCSFSGKV